MYNNDIILTLDLSNTIGNKILNFGTGGNVTVEYIRVTSYGTGRFFSIITQAFGSKI